MKRREFFLRAMNDGRYKEKRWIFAAFSVLRAGPSSTFENMRPWDILTIQRKDQIETGLDPVENKDGPTAGLTFIHGDAGEPMSLDDYNYDHDNPQPVYQFRESVEIYGGEVPNLSEDITTTYGILLANYILLIEPFGDKIPFINRKFTIKDVEKIIEQRLTTTPPEDEPRDPETIYVDEYYVFRKAAGLIEGLSQLCVPSATAKSMTRHPDTVKKREELLEQYKDRLHDPATIALIEEEMKKLDMEHLKGDRSLDFYIKGKSLDPVRKKAYLIMGLEEAFGSREDAELIVNSLVEGIDPEHLPAMVNSLREGSFDRSSQTQLGGEVTKIILRAMQNSQIVEEDCGTKIGLSLTIDPDMKNQYLGNYIIDDEKVVELNEDNIDQYSGRTVQLRTPLFCRTGDDDFCQTCIGKRYAKHPTGLPTAAANVGSTFMGIFMSSMHAKALKTRTYNPIDHLY